MQRELAVKVCAANN